MNTYRLFALFAAVVLATAALLLLSSFDGAAWETQCAAMPLKPGEYRGPTVEQVEAFMIREGRSPRTDSFPD